jgi:predicted dehydrogenase
MSKVRIGILGAANIAPTAIIKPARAVDRAVVTAVAARDRSRAEAFAGKWSIPTVHASYDELIADPDIDAIYNPLPNAVHAEWSIKALQAGKHLLCEKPFTSNAEQAREVAAVAAVSDGVLMEAFHYRYHPMMQRAIEVARSGELGELRHVESWMQVPLFKRHDIRFDLALGGGAVMDLGCYSIHQLRSLTGAEPSVTAATAKERKGDPGVDRWMEAQLQFPDGPTGTFTVSLYGGQPLRIAFRAVGTKGELRVVNPAGPQMFHRFTIRGTDGSKRREKFPKVATYQYQLEAFCDAVLDGSPVLTNAADSIANMEVIDAVYTAAGLPLRP